MLYLLLAACRPPEGDDSSPRADDPLAPQAVEVTPTEVGAVLRVAWTTASPTVGRVDFGETEALGRSTVGETAPTTEHEVLVVGLPAFSDAYVRPVTVTDDGEVPGPLTPVETGIQPQGLQSLYLDGEPDPDGGYLLAPILGNTYAATIVDAQGRYVWWWVEDRGYIVQRVALGRDGASVLYNAVWLGDLSGKGEIVRRGLDGALLATYEVPLHTHDFVELPDGTLTTMAYDVREVDGETLIGDRLVDVAPDGTLTEVWNAWDWFDPSIAPPPDALDLTWTHANAIDYVEAEDAWYLSLRNFDSIVKIDRATGDLVWGLGGLANDFTFPEGSRPFDGQHQFQRLDDGILVFDNGSMDGQASRAVEYALDLDTFTATERWSHESDPPLWIWAMGDVARSPLGHTRVTWSTGGRVDWVTPEGEVIGSFLSPLGWAVGYTEQVDALPFEAPG